MSLVSELNRPHPTRPRENSTKLGDTWWLFNGVAGRLTLEPLRASAGPPSIVFMGDGLSLVKAQSSVAEADLMPYVQELLDIHDKYTELVGTGPEKGCFQGHSIFHKAMKEAFEVFVNKDIGKTSTAELLSNFCDNLLKKSGERLSEKAVASA